MLVAEKLVILADGKPFPRLAGSLDFPLSGSLPNLRDVPFAFGVEYAVAEFRMQLSAVPDVGRESD